ncbi:MAG: glycoside hydrolase family 20 zincin-like fold domain-containing protein, partial [Pyrinomonadaceae bacterium]
MRTTLSRSAGFKFALVCALAFFCVSASAQTRTQVYSPKVIPAPKQVTSGSGSFPVQDARIALADTKSAEDRFAAGDFIDDLRTTAQVSLSIGKGKSRREILIGRLDLPSVAQALKRNNFDIPTSLTDEGYVILATADRVIVAGKTAAGTFYGLQTLKQLVRGEGATAFVPSARIVDWPTMRWRGLSDDISRGPVPTVDYIKRQIRTLAFFKMNMHSFYMEH